MVCRLILLIAWQLSLLWICRYTCTELRPHCAEITFTCPSSPCHTSLILQHACGSRSGHALAASTSANISRWLCGSCTSVSCQMLLARCPMLPNGIPAICVGPLARQELGTAACMLCTIPSPSKRTTLRLQLSLRSTAIPLSLATSEVYLRGDALCTTWHLPRGTG